MRLRRRKDHRLQARAEREREEQERMRAHQKEIDARLNRIMVQAQVIARIPKVGNA